LPVIKKIPNKIEKSFWVKSLSNILETREEDILEELEKVSYLNDRKENFEKLITPIPEEEFSQAKDRKGLLEEQLIVLIIQSPENLDLLKKEDFDLLSPKTSEIIQRFKEQGFDLENVSNEIDKIIDYLSLKAEVQSFLENSSDAEKNEENYNEENKQEFKNCLKELKILAFRNNLDYISKEIKKSEKSKDFNKVKELVREFNSFSKSFEDLKNA